MMSEEARRRGAGKTLVPVLSCNLVEELYTSAGQLVKRGKRGLRQGLRVDSRFIVRNPFPASPF